MVMAHRPAGGAALRHESLPRRLLRMALDVVSCGLCLLALCLVLKPLLILLLLVIFGSVFWLLARILYWLVSLVPMWFDPESCGRLHRWPKPVNALICLAIGGAVWLALHRQLSLMLQRVALWFTPSAPDAPQATAQLIGVVDAIAGTALAALGAALKAVIAAGLWLLALLHLLSSAGRDQLVADWAAWQAWLDFHLSAYCPAASAVPMPDLLAGAPGIGCRWLGHDLYFWTVILLLAAACWVLYRQRSGEAARLCRLER